MVKDGDKYYVEDGHHRIAKDIKDGKTTVEAEVYEAKKPKLKEEVKDDTKDEQGVRDKGGEVPEQTVPDKKPGTKKVKRTSPLQELEKRLKAGEDVFQIGKDLAKLKLGPRTKKAFMGKLKVKQVEHKARQKLLADEAFKELTTERKKEVEQKIYDATGKIFDALDKTPKLMDEGRKPLKVKAVFEGVVDLADALYQGGKIEKDVFLKKLHDVVGEMNISLEDLKERIDEIITEVTKRRKVPKTKVQKDIDKTVEGKPKGEKVTVNDLTVFK